MTRIPPTLRLDAGVWGSLLAAGGIVLATVPSLLAAAIGVELVAAAFWVWARAADDASVQVPRWEWLRRPASALWLAAAIHAVAPNMTHGALLADGGATPWFHWIEAIAVLWACLELMAALPIARPYSDLSGPLLEVRPWLPVMLPAVGFVVLWTHASHWQGVAPVRQAAAPLLLLTALLGALRAFARRSWTASLRWLAVSDSALAGLLVASGTVPTLVSLMLWLAALGAHAALLAGELRGALPRRGVLNLRLWRAASWTAWASLSLPVVAGAGAAAGGMAGWALHVAAAIPVAIGAWVGVARLVGASERRHLSRPSPTKALSQFLALVVLVAGPAALVLAGLAGVLPAWPVFLAALAPAALAGAAGAIVASRRGEVRPPGSLRSSGGALPGFAGRLYRMVVGFERAVLAVAVRVARTMVAPFRDLHTGDAQEYLLFLIGLGVLALVLPLLA